MAKVCERCAGSGAVDTLTGRPWSEAKGLPGDRFPVICTDCGGGGWDGPSPDEEADQRLRTVDIGASRGRRR